MALSLIPVVLAMVCFLATMGFWSAINISQKSQLERLETILLAAAVAQERSPLIPSEHINIALVDTNDKIVGEVILTRIVIDRQGAEPKGAEPKLDSAYGHIIVDEKFL